ncbi:hypothetical protein [Sulfitobacter dubius]|uniref:hypothetical protein n=1 Tax=Sulfitobacter dubius TaxID=218673 RepID=UPI0029431EBF|nr:hypothetical protein [Sulfitobacter dubius]WOI29571.1 hypothetical protein R1T39_02365 [Sulfitobacter dubius]
MPDSIQQFRPKQDPLGSAVRQTLTTDGVRFEGKVWAIRSLNDWADIAGISTKTVSRKFKLPPYDTLRKVVEGKQAILVRIGAPDPNQPSRLAATMAKMFKNQTGHVVSARGYGCLHGLVQDWRAGWQVEIFKYAISPDGWKMIKALSKYKTEDLITPLDATGGMIKLLPGKAHLYQEYPHILTLRLFWMCAENAFVDSKLDGSLSNKEETFWLDWWQDVDTDALVAWLPNWKGHFDPIMDVKN